jgi:tetratricopeptide (TPR) repeat protein
LPRQRFAALTCVLTVAACTGRASTSVHPLEEPRPDRIAPASGGSTDTDPDEDPARVLALARDALVAQRSAHAIALFGRYLASQNPSSVGVGQAYLGLARAHEQLGDCAAAVRAYDDYLRRLGDDAEVVSVLVRRGACEAEIGQWERSAASFHQAAAQPDLLPSVYVEALAREGLALFNLDRFAEADRVLSRADEIFERARHDDTERFSDYYFVGMARFYRAAILHLQFREVRLELPEQAMEDALQRKLERLTSAQDAYNHTIAAKHMFWVSAAGYQLGHMFGEFYDEVMHAPVPTWLDQRQRAIYYEELKKQLRPVIEKAVWAFDKNLETARRLGYESPFIERTQAKLGHLQAMLISDEASLGRPNPKLVQESARSVGPPEDPQTAGSDAAAVAERKLFVPRPTSL